MTYSKKRNKMKRQYYIVKLQEDIDIPIFCEVEKVIDTQKYGFAYIFRDIITQKNNKTIL